MAKYIILTRLSLPASNFAVGNDTGTLYLMLNRNEGVVIVGDGTLAGCEGKTVHASSGKGVRYLPAGTTIYIET